MLKRVWREGTPLIVLVGMLIGSGTRENSMKSESEKYGSIFVRKYESQSYLTLWDPMGCLNSGLGRLSLLQGSFPTQGLNPGVPNCRQMLHHLSHQASPV